MNYVEIEMLKEQARDLARLYKQEYLHDEISQFMCIRAQNNRPQLYRLLYITFKDRSLLTELMNNMCPGGCIISRRPNAVRYHYLRYIGRYGRVPPWKLVYQWVLKTNDILTVVM